jgi:hypothetical protein
VEAEEPQEPQEILANALARLTDEPDPAFGQVRGPAEGVVDAAVGRQRDGVDREVAARGVGRPIIGEVDDGAPSICLAVDPQRGDLDGILARPDDRRDGAVREACRNDPDAGPLEAFDDRLGPQGGRQVDILDRSAGQGIAHTTADQAGLLAILLQRRDDAANGGRVHPGLPHLPVGRGLGHSPASASVGSRTSAKFPSIPAVAPQM